MAKKSRSVLDQTAMNQPAQMYEVQRVWDYVADNVDSKLDTITDTLSKIEQRTSGLATKEDLDQLREDVSGEIDAKIEVALGKDAREYRTSARARIVTIVVSLISLAGMVTVAIIQANSK